MNQTSTQEHYMSQLNPCQFHPDLLEERIRAIAKIIKDARNEAASEYDELRGDTPWLTGCKGFNWAWQRLLKVAGTPGFEWFSVRNASMHFVGSIGAIPIRFYRGSANKPTARTLRQVFAEFNQYSLDLDVVDQTTENYLYRFAIETTLEGQVERVIFAALQPNSGDVVASFEAYTTDKITVISSVNKPQEAEVNLPAPLVSGKRRKKIQNGENS